MIPFLSPLQKGTINKLNIKMCMLEMKEVYSQRGTPARELEPTATATYRLGIFVRWVEKSQEGHSAG
jgi:hypothetical protein